MQDGVPGICKKKKKKKNSEKKRFKILFLILKIITYLNG